MTTTQRTFLALGVMLLVAGGCQPPPPPSPRAQAADDGALPVALVVDGSAAARPGAADSIAAALAGTIHRRVVVVTPPDPKSDPALARLAARVAREHRATARYDWREPRCAAQVAARVATGTPVAGVYHVTVDATERTRPVEPVDAARGVSAGWTPPEVLYRMGLAGPPMVVEEWIGGTVSLTTFTGDAAPARAPVSAVAVHRAGGAERADLGSIVRDASKGLPAPREPRWEAAATRLVSGGCPFLGLAVYEARVRHARPGNRVMRTAVAAMSRHAARRLAHRKTAKPPTRTADRRLP